MPSGNWKYSETYNSTLDPSYHALIACCEANNMEWKLVRVFDNKVMYESKNT